MSDEFSFDVFLSHSSKDKQLVRAIAERLKKDGLRVWLNEWEIKAGDHWAKKIDEGLEQSRVLVLCMSANAFGSEWAQLESYTFRFRDPLNKGCRFIPLRLDDAPIKGSLAQFQYINWLPDAGEEAYAKLLEACRQATTALAPHNSSRPTQFAKADFGRLSRARRRVSIDQDVRRKNLAQSDWRYDALLLPALRESGWIRFAAGFKSGIYGHATHAFCIKVLGMGVGDDPSYFAGRGYYNQHERRMLESFARHGFRFQPRAQSVEESIAFLIEECGLDPDQAHWQCDNHNVLITERILGIPFATATGHGLCYEPDIAVFDSTVLGECERALHELKWFLDEANRVGLRHNDPVPANVVFEEDDRGRIVARLIDFELAQDLGESSPDYVVNSVRELYAERDVPLNTQTAKYRLNLDQHLMEQALEALGRIRRRVEEYETARSGMDWLSFTFSFVGGISLNFGDASRTWLQDAGVI